MFEQRKQDKLIHHFAKMENFHHGLVAYHMSPDGMQKIAAFLDGKQIIPQNLLAEVQKPFAVIFNREAGIVAFATEKIRDWVYFTMPDRSFVQRYTA